MDKLKLKIITPQKTILDEMVESVSLPTFRGEITDLLHHANLFSLLVEGVVRIKSSRKEDHIAIGGGYLETDGGEVNILVSKAYGQDGLDQNIILKAIENAKNILKISKDKKERTEASQLLRHSIVSLKLLKKRRHRTTPV